MKSPSALEMNVSLTDRDERKSWEKIISCVSVPYKNNIKENLLQRRVREKKTFYACSYKIASVCRDRMHCS